MTRDDVYRQVQSLIKDKGLCAASACVLALGEAQAVAAGFEHLIIDCYHEAKSIEQVLHFGSAGIHYCLASARELDGQDTAAAREFRYAAKRMATNVASFTWPGWDEPGVTISPKQVRQGLMYARFSVRQLQELDPTPAQQAYTYWFLGAQLLAHGEFAEALSVFKTALVYNLEHGEEPEGRLMLEGYIGLTAMLDRCAEPGEAAFHAAVAALQAHASEDARFYAEQLVAVRAIFTAQQQPST